MKHTGKNYFIRNQVFYWMLLPGVLYFLIFKIIPLFGIIIAFYDYKPYFGITGLFSTEFVGFKWFGKFFNSIYAKRLITNTIWISLLKLFWGFPAPIILALFLNEIRNEHIKKGIQTITYIPHFLSWVIVSGILRQLVTTDGGFVNTIITFFGHESILFLGNAKYFRSLLVISDIWKGVGWGSIIYLAAISGIDQELYEAAKVDGAGILRCMRSITIPCILPTISVMLILRVGALMDGNFEQIQLLLTSQVYPVGDIIDTYVYREGILNMSYSYTTAISLFKSIIGITLVTITDRFAKRVGQEGIW